LRMCSRCSITNSMGVSTSCLPSRRRKLVAKLTPTMPPVSRMHQCSRAQRGEPCVSILRQLLNVPDHPASCRDCTGLRQMRGWLASRACVAIDLLRWFKPRKCSADRILTPLGTNPSRYRDTDWHWCSACHGGTD
jgi:hypothetical protein